MTKKTRKIYAQGDLDGACYLYSIANSYAALTGKRLTPAQWKSSINILPFKLDDFLTGRGTESLDDTPNYFEGLCRNFLERVRHSCFQVSRNENVTSKSLRDSLTENQVAIVAIDDGNHWVSLVDADKHRFYLACSAAALNPEDGLYDENRSPNYQRYYNRTLSFSDLRLWNNYALLIGSSKS